MLSGKHELIMYCSVKLKLKKDSFKRPSVHVHVQRMVYMFDSRGYCYTKIVYYRTEKLYSARLLIAACGTEILCS